MTRGRLTRSEVNQGTDSDSSSAVMGRTEEGELLGRSRRTQSRVAIFKADAGQAVQVGEEAS